jgi:hypothetical protein
MLLLYISFYVFKAIFFQNIELLGFEILKNVKVEDHWITLSGGDKKYDVSITL